MASVRNLSFGMNSCEEASGRTDRAGADLLKNFREIIVDPTNVEYIDLLCNDFKSGAIYLNFSDNIPDPDDFVLDLWMPEMKSFDKSYLYTSSNELYHTLIISNIPVNIRVKQQRILNEYLISAQSTASYYGYSLTVQLVHRLNGADIVSAYNAGIEYLYRDSDKFELYLNPLVNQQIESTED